MRHGALTGSLVVAAIVASPAARADCALGESYASEAIGNTVIVCVTADSLPTQLVRQSADGGPVVELGGPCVSPAQFPDGGVASIAFAADGGFSQVNLNNACCFEDDCVPAGSYRYGLATPIACPNGCGGIAPWWVSATVTSEMDGGCIGTAPVPYANGAPWPSSGEQTRQCSGCHCSASSSVLSFDAFVFLAAAIWLGLRRRRQSR
jgi:hypothetical protein